MPKVVQVLVRVLGGGTRLITGEVGKRAAVLLHALQVRWDVGKCGESVRRQSSDHRKRAAVRMHALQV